MARATMCAGPSLSSGKPHDARSFYHKRRDPRAAPGACSHSLDGLREFGNFAMTEVRTTLDLDALEAALAAATAGPWRQVSGDLDGFKTFGIAGVDQPSGQTGPVVCMISKADDANEADQANAAAIVALFNAAPALIAAAREAEVLRAECGRMEREIDDIRCEPWPAWASSLLDVMREFTGERYDEVDLPEELRTWFDGYRAELETAALNSPLALEDEAS